MSKMTQAKRTSFRQVLGKFWVSFWQVLVNFRQVLGKFWASFRQVLKMDKNGQKLSKMVK